MNPNFRPVFCVSVLLNLLLLGMMFGHYWQALLSPFAPPTPQQIVSALSPLDQKKFETALAKASNEITPLRTQISAARSASLCILGSEPFDKSAYLTKTSELHHLHEQLTARMITAVTQTANLPAPARVAFADMLRPPAPPAVPQNNCAKGEK